MPTGSRFARTAYMIFVMAVLLALSRLGGFSDANPLYLKMVPTTPIAKAAKPVAGESPEDEALDLPDVDGLASGLVGRLLIITSVVSSLPRGEETPRSKKSSPDDAPVF